MKWVLALIVAFFPLSAFAACPDVGNSAGYVRAAAGGTASGADWTNAYVVLPASLVRGCTYYVAGGSYAAHTFNDADSGATLITIQAPTVASHGTATGWNNAYAAQATFTAPIYFTGSAGGTAGDYYVFNGAYRASTGSPWLDWRSQSGYGFAINNNNGSNCPISNVNNGAALAVGQLNNNNAASHVAVEYVNIIGSGNLAQSACGNGFDWGVSVNGNTVVTNNFYLGYSYVHDTAADNILFDGCNNCTAEYDYIDRSSEGSGTNHMEEIAVRNNTDNFIFRYNFIGACGDTACFASPNASGARSGWYIYGNIIFINTSETPVTYSSGDGWLSIFSLTSLTTFYIVNNTISNLSTAGPCGVFPWTPVTTSGGFYENNLTYSCTQNNNPALNTGLTWDYNAYYSSPTMFSNDTSTHVSGANATNPFVNVANSANANNFNLTGHTTAGVSISSQPPGCTANVNCIGTDMNGVTGTDRGALNFTNSVSSPAPVPAFFSWIWDGAHTGGQ